MTIFDHLIDILIKNGSKSIGFYLKVDKFNQSRIKIDQFSGLSFYQHPNLSSDFELYIIWMTKLLESQFELTTIQYVGPNCLSLLESNNKASTLAQLSAIVE